MALLAAGHLKLAAFTFFCTYGVTLSIQLVHKDPKPFMSVVLGTLPILMLLRSSLFYNSPEAILAVGLGFWTFQSPGDIRKVLSDRLVQSFCFIAVIYWIISFALTGDYSANLRIFELLFSALAIALLGQYRDHLGTSLIGLAISTLAMGVALAGFGERLGMAEIGGERLGNPISFGIPVALLFLLSMCERGRWVLLEERPIWRLIVNIAAGVLLALSTSRGSWAVVAVCILVMLIAQRRRLRLLAYILAVAGLLAGWIHFANPAGLEKYFYKTFDSPEYWSADNNARVAQWQSFPTAFGDSPVWGFGPGMGKSVSLHYSGHKLIWHSLYLHVAIECGLIGLLLLSILLGTLIVRSIRHAKVADEVAPLLGVIGFMVVATTIPAIDAASGLFLGFSLLTSQAPRLWVLRTRSQHEANLLLQRTAQFRLQPNTITWRSQR
jgi:O-Antigen ligase